MIEILAYTDTVQDWSSETFRCLNLNQYFWILARLTRSKTKARCWLTEPSCFLFCLSPGIIINYEKATFEVTFNLKLTTLNLCIIIVTIQCPFKVPMKRNFLLVPLKDLSKWWRMALFYCDSTLGCRVIQDFNLCKLDDLWRHFVDKKWCKKALSNKIIKNCAS